jgi:hypothetical protein
MIIIAHIILYLIKEESLTSFLFGVVSMICMIISVIISNKKE